MTTLLFFLYGANAIASLGVVLAWLRVTAVAWRNRERPTTIRGLRRDVYLILCGSLLLLGVAIAGMRAINTFSAVRDGLDHLHLVNPALCAFLSLMLAAQMGFHCVARINRGAKHWGWLWTYAAITLWAGVAYHIGDELPRSAFVVISPNSF